MRRSEGTGLGDGRWSLVEERQARDETLGGDMREMQRRGGRAKAARTLKCGCMGDHPWAMMMHRKAMGRAHWGPRRDVRDDDDGEDVAAVINAEDDAEGDSEGEGRGKGRHQQRASECAEAKPNVEAENKNKK